MNSQTVSPEKPNPAVEEFVQDCITLIDSLEFICGEIDDQEAECDKLSRDDWRLVEHCLLGIRCECGVLRDEIFEVISGDLLPANCIVLPSVVDLSSGLTTIFRREHERIGESLLKERRQPVFAKIEEYGRKPGSEHLCDAVCGLFGLICSVADRILDSRFPAEDMSRDDWSDVQSSLSETEIMAFEVYHSLFEVYDASEPTDPSRVVIEYGEGGDSTRDAVRLTELAAPGG